MAVIISSWLNKGDAEKFIFMNLVRLKKIVFIKGILLEKFSSYINIASHFGKFLNY